MPGLNTDLGPLCAATVRLQINYVQLPSDCKPMKQKLKHKKPEWNMKKEEVVKQLYASFLEVIDYPEWLANIVPVAKKVKKVRM